MVSFARSFALSFLIVKGANAFSPLSMKPSLASVSKVGSRLNMADGPADGKKIPSGRKEIGFDAASGRFYETGRTAEECVPDDEYCVVDKDSGKLVRLTLKEKERIFLDALQVREMFGLFVPTFYHRKCSCIWNFAEHQSFENFTFAMCSFVFLQLSYLARD